MGHWQKSSYMLAYMRRICARHTSSSTRPNDVCVQNNMLLYLQVRMERVRLRTEQTRQARHAKILRTVWQTHSGVTWQDLVVACLATATAIGVVHVWKPMWRPDAAAEPLAPQQQADAS